MGARDPVRGPGNRYPAVMSDDDPGSITAWSHPRGRRCEEVGIRVPEYRALGIPLFITQGGGVILEYGPEWTSRWL
ncbi:hypothetical protein GCM10027184_76410 [Saccharothrix stipae]